MDPLQPSHKYHGEQDSRYDGKLQWPGANGFPFLGDAPPSLKQAEIENLPIVGVTHQHLFDLNDEDDLAYYSWVRERIRNGLFVRDYIDRQRPDPDKYPIVYLEWTQCYVQSSKQQQSTIGGNGHGSSRHFTLRGPA